MRTDVVWNSLIGSFSNHYRDITITEVQYPTFSFQKIIKYIQK